MAIILAISLLTATSAFTAETIKIGVPLAMTGAYAGSGDNFWKGITMATSEINENGGLLGKQIEIVRFDSQEFAPEVVMQGANYLCGKMKVTSVHAGWAGWGQDIRAYGKYDAPFFCDDGAKPAVDVYKSNPEKYYNTYFIADHGEDQANSMFKFLTALPYEYPNKKVVLINTDDTWGMEVGDTLEKRFKKIGWKVAMHETVPYGINEWGPILTKIRRINPALFILKFPAHRKLSPFFISLSNSQVTRFSAMAGPLHRLKFWRASVKLQMVSSVKCQQVCRPLWPQMKKARPGWTNTRVSINMNFL